MTFRKNLKRAPLFIFLSGFALHNSFDLDVDSQVNFGNRDLYCLAIDTLLYGSVAKAIGGIGERSIALALEDGNRALLP